MENGKEQSPGSLRCERFARLSAPAAGLSWNTYKRLHARVERHIERKRATGNVDSCRKITITPGADPAPPTPAAPEKDKKTIGCKFWKKGTCTKGKKCDYKHSGLAP